VLNVHSPPPTATTTTQKPTMMTVRMAQTMADQMANLLALAEAS
jgi:hypothetical protein